MSQRQEVESRLALFSELSGILGAMRSFALTELRRVSKREAAQQQVVAAIALALDDVAAALPVQRPDKSGNGVKDIWLLFGSVRGFCGSFNEDVLRIWQERATGQAALIVLGERMYDMFTVSTERICITGAESGLQAAAAIDRILAAMQQVRGGEDGQFRLWGCFRDEAGARSQQLWPLPAAAKFSNAYPPLSYLALPELAIGVAEHYLFHRLLAILLRSIRVENHMRLMQMETALRHLERGSEDLQRLRNRLRQEEIVEEIELMIGGRIKN